MDRLDRGGQPQFSHPVRQIVLMLIVLCLVAVGGYFAGAQVAPVFLSSVWLNGAIALVFLIGIVACFWQVILLISSVNWIEGHAAETPGHQHTRPPRMLAPLAALLRSRGKAMQMSATSSRSILDSVATRIDEARDITRYIVNLLIFLGLLGTFYGLATTVPAIVETIRGLAPQQGEDGMAVFERLMNGLQAQLGGMGIAFSSSLLGLAGSLVVGLLELFAGHGQNRFYRELEEWLSTITRLSYSSGEGDMTSDQALVAQMMEHVAEQMDRLHTMFASSDASRGKVDLRLGQLAESMTAMTRKMETEASIAGMLARVADGQERLATALETQIEDGAGALDPESRMRLRSIDVQLLRLLEEMSAGRQEATSELRHDLRQLLRAIRQATDQPEGGKGRDNVGIGRVG